MNNMIKIAALCIGFVIGIFVSNYDYDHYRKDITIQIEDNNQYDVRKWIWKGSYIIYMKSYKVTTSNLDSLYKATIADCDTIIKKHKKAFKEANK